MAQHDRVALSIPPSFWRKKSVAIFVFFRQVVQLNIHQTELLLWFVSHDLTLNCLLISESLPRFEKICGTMNTELLLFWFFTCRTILVTKYHFLANVKTKTILCSFAAKLIKFSEINKQFNVKSWLTNQSYSSVWAV